MPDADAGRAGPQGGGRVPVALGNRPRDEVEAGGPPPGVRPRRAYAAARIAAAFTSSLTAPAKVSKFASKRACRSRAVRS